MHSHDSDKATGICKVTLDLAVIGFGVCQKCLQTRRFVQIIVKRPVKQRLNRIASRLTESGNQLDVGVNFTGAVPGPYKCWRGDITNIT